MIRRAVRLISAAVAAALTLSFCACSGGYGLAYDPRDYVSSPGQYTGMTITLQSTVVTDQDVTDAINKLFRDKATKEEITEGTVENGDDILITYTGTLDGVKVDRFSGVNTEIIVGNGALIDDVEDSLPGRQVGSHFVIETDVEDTFDDEELAGKHIVIDMVVVAKLRTVYPELTDEMAMSQGNPEFFTAEQMREYYKKKLAAEKQEAQDDQKYLDTWEKVVGNFEVSGYPEGTVDKYIDVMVRNAVAAAETYGVTYEDYISYMDCHSDAEYREFCIPGAQQAVKKDIVFYYLLGELGINHSKGDARKYAEENHDDLGYDSADDLIAEYGTDYIIEFLNRMDLWDYLVEHNSYVVEGE